MKAQRVLEVCVYAGDLDAAEKFYREVLGLQFYSRVPGRHVFFRCQDSMFLVFNPENTATAETLVGGQKLPNHGCSGQGHVAFASSEVELSQWTERLTASGIEIEADVTWPGGGRSIYIRDPAGNSVELATPRLWGMGEEE